MPTDKVPNFGDAFLQFKNFLFSLRSSHNATDPLILGERKCLRLLR
jgi:hypothetical protein